MVTSCMWLRVQAIVQTPVHCYMWSSNAPKRRHASRQLRHARTGFIRLPRALALDENSVLPCCGPCPTHLQVCEVNSCAPPLVGAQPAGGLSQGAHGGLKATTVQTISVCRNIRCWVTCCTVETRWEGDITPVSSLKGWITQSINSSRAMWHFSCAQALWARCGRDMSRTALQSL